MVSSSPCDGLQRTATLSRFGAAFVSYIKGLVSMCDVGNGFSAIGASIVTELADEMGSKCPILTFGFLDSIVRQPVVSHGPALFDEIISVTELCQVLRKPITHQDGGEFIAYSNAFEFKPFERTQSIGHSISKDCRCIHGCGRSDSLFSVCISPLPFPRKPTESTVSESRTSATSWRQPRPTT